MDSIPEASGSDRERDETWRSAGHTMDPFESSGSDTITDHELLVYLLHSGHNDKTIQALFRALDGKGSISREEWFRALRPPSPQPAPPVVALGVPGEYEGGLSAVGEREGRGTSHWPEGDTHGVFIDDLAGFAVCADTFRKIVVFAWAGVK